MERILCALFFTLLTIAPLRLQAAPAEHKREIAAVTAGTLQTAHASWWGFEKEDATACLQAAIDSKVPTLIVDNTGSDWIINQPLNLVSNQQIIFADGVVVQAKKGGFKGIGDSLLRGRNLENITLRGEGKAVLQMQKADYQNPELYKPGEWRHGINLGGCTNVTIRNLTIRETGGDGLYVGGAEKPFCENVRVEDVVFDGNHRLGMAVISAENLAVRRCKFINALGASPQGGIDFEPNRPQERLVNCVVENSVFSHNAKGAGASVSPNHLNSESLPVSVTFKQCTFNDNALGIFLYPSRRSTTEPATGQVEFINCELKLNPVLLQDPVANGVRILFRDCTIDNTGGRSEAFKIVCKEAAGRAIGNLIFDNTTVIEDDERAPIAIKYQGSGEISDAITGTLYVEHADRRELFNLPEFVRREQTKFQKINAQKPAVLQLDRLSTPTSDTPREDNSEMYLRGRFTFLQYATKGQVITITARAVKVGNYSGETELQLHTPDDRVLRRDTLPPDSQPYPITFTAEQTGFYRVTCNGTVQRLDITSPHPGSGILLDAPQTFLPIQGRIYFQVPAGVREFFIGVASDAGADVTLLDATGKEIEKRHDIDSMELFSATRADASASEIWSLSFSKVIWQVTLRCYAPLVPIVSTNPATLPQSGTP